MKSFVTVIFLVTLSLAILGAIFYFMFVYTETTEEYIGLAQLETYQNGADSYMRKMLDYKNVCQEIGLRDVNIYCIDNTDGYRMIAPQTDGSFFCADNSGFLGRVTVVRNGTFACEE